jgi:hypothetical protein
MPVRADWTVRNGALQRLRRLLSDTLVYDLKFRFRCRKCNSRRDTFEVTVKELPR